MVRKLHHQVRRKIINKIGRPTDTLHCPFKNPNTYITFSNEIIHIKTTLFVKRIKWIKCAALLINFCDDIHKFQFQDNKHPIHLQQLIWQRWFYISNLSRISPTKLRTCQTSPKTEKQVTLLSRYTI